MSQIVNPNICYPKLCSFYSGVQTNYIYIILPDMIKYIGLNLDKWLNVTWVRDTVRYGE